MSLALVLISSSGESPYLEIEGQGQEATFAAQDTDVIFRWAEGDPSKRRKPLARITNWVVAMHRKIGKLPVIQLRPFGFLGSPRLTNHVGHLLSHNGRRITNLLIEVDFSLYQLRAWLVRSLVRLVCSLAYQRGTRNISGRRVRLRAPSSYHLGPMRLVEKLEFFENEASCPYLLLTTSTCYVNPRALRQTLKTMQSTGVYAGTVLRSEGVEFAAGNNILLSRDVARLVLENKSKLRHDLPDDVALGQLISQIGLPGPSEIGAEETPLGSFSAKSLSATWEDKPVIRCKVSPRTRNSQEVVSRIQTVHQLLSGR